MPPTFSSAWYLRVRPVRAEVGSLLGQCDVGKLLGNMLRQRAIEHLLQAELLGRLQSNLIAHQHGPEHRDQASHEEDQHHNAREGTQFRG